MNRSFLSAPIIGFAFLGIACSDGSGTPPGSNPGVGGGMPGAGGSGQPGVGGSGQPGVGGSGQPGVGGSGQPGVGGSGQPGAGGTGQPGAGGTGQPGVGGDSGTGGGTAGTGGSGGSAPEEPSLVTSGPDSGWWMEGAVTMGGGGTTVTVNINSVLQEWHGWGGTFNEAGWDALKAVSAEDRDMVIRLLFHPWEGAGFTYGRIPIGSSDYGLNRYSLNDQAGDFEMTNFSIERDKQDLIPYIKEAMKHKPDIRFWASPWSPPPWMKNGGKNGGFDGGTMKTDDQTLGAHALYLARFVQEYEKEGIYIEAVHPQNEPNWEQDYPSCIWDAAGMTKYIGQFLGPLFADMLPDREVWLGTMSNTTSDSIVGSVMGNATAASYVKGIGLQWGQVQNAQKYVNNYDVPVMQTEHQCGNNPWEGHDQSRAPNDYAYGVESWNRIKEWLNTGVNSYLAWNMVLDTVGRSLDTVRPWAQNALIAIDRGSGTVNITPYYYVFRHLAQFVEPGSVRVQTSGGDALAWKNPDGSVVAIVYNSGNAPAMTTVSIGGTEISGEVPGRGWATFNWQG